MHRPASATFRLPAVKAIEMAADLAVIRPEQASARASASALVIPLFAGTGVPSLTSGVEPSPPGQRLQSITRRE